MQFLLQSTLFLEIRHHLKIPSLSLFPWEEIDTIAAMTGAIAGAFWGYKRIPSWLLVVWKMEKWQSAGRKAYFEGC